ncbi:MAG: GAF domain-containing protein, partial [Nocardioidaceae bacterium]
MSSDVHLPAGPADERAGPAAVFRNLADIVYASDDFDDIYNEVCTVTPRLVSGCDHASLMVSFDGKPVTFAASDEIARRVDGLERELNEGPCVDAITGAPVYVSSDFPAESPWPKLTAKVLAQTPVRGAAGFRLRVGDHQVGALNLFADLAGQLDDRSVNEGIMLASFVSVTLAAVSQREAAASLRAGLDSNREIGKAVGLMMAFYK